MTSLARVEHETRGDVPVVRIVGEVDASNVREIGDVLRQGLSNHSHRLVVDLSPTTYLDSAGINLLFALGQEMRRRQQELHLVVGEASPIARMLSLTGLDQAVPTHAVLEDAI